MCRETLNLELGDEIEDRTANGSWNFFAKHPDFDVKLDAPIAEEFDALASKRGWKPNAVSGIYEKKWKACFGPDVPVGDYQLIDDRCPFVFLDQYWGPHWEPECGVGFDDYFYRLAAKKGWKKGAKSGTFDRMWTLCFGCNMAVGTPPRIPVVKTCDCPPAEGCDQRSLDDDGDMGEFWRDVKRDRRNNPPQLEDMPASPARDALLFFNKYPKFSVQPNKPVLDEFQRLARSRQWVQGANSQKYERAWNDCLEILREHTNVSLEYGEDEVEDDQSSADWEEYIDMNAIRAMSGKPPLGNGWYFMGEPADTDSEASRAEYLSRLHRLT